MLKDGDGGVFGTAGVYFAESEYEWDGITRGGVTYSRKLYYFRKCRIPMNSVVSVGPPLLCKFS